MTEEYLSEETIIDYDNLVGFVNRMSYWALHVEMIACFMLNAISMTCIVHAKAFTNINILIMNLTLSDILYASLIPYFSKQFDAAQSADMGQFGCTMSFMLDVVCMIVSLLITNYLSII